MKQGQKWEYPEDNPYGECTMDGKVEVYYNMTSFLNDSEVQQIWSIIGKACDRENIEFMASVFDIERISWLEELNVSTYKIASRSINDESLILNVIKTKKPVLISLGMWNQKDLPCYKGDIKYLYCISKYPTPLEDINFSEIDFDKYYLGIEIPKNRSIDIDDIGDWKLAETLYK